jgi:sugar fermentation stimulation protein A
MQFSAPLQRATLIRRYKRFLADVRLADGSEVTAHCPTPGSMMGLRDPGLSVWLEQNDDPKKKLKYGWRLAELPDKTLVGVDTSLPNRIVGEALDAGRIPPLAEYQTHKPEVKYSQKSRIDFLLSGDELPDLYLEVKSATLSRRVGVAEFPDSVTARGAKHLTDLSDMVAQGHRAVMLYLVQRTDCMHFDLARDLDPTYANAFEAAMAAGVEALCYGTQITPNGIALKDRLAIQT